LRVHHLPPTSGRLGKPASGAFEAERQGSVRLGRRETGGRVSVFRRTGRPVLMRRDRVLVSMLIPAPALLRARPQAGHYEVRVIERGEDASQATAEFEPDMISARYCLPGIDGVETTRRLREWSQAPSSPWTGGGRSSEGRSPGHGCRRLRGQAIRHGGVARPDANRPAWPATGRRPPPRPPYLRT